MKLYCYILVILLAFISSFSENIHCRDQIITGEILIYKDGYLLVESANVLYKIKENCIDLIELNNYEIKLEDIALRKFDKKVNWNKYSETIEIKDKKPLKNKSGSFFSGLFGKNKELKRKPEGLNAKVTDDNMITLLWNDVFSSETGFRIDRKVGDHPWIFGYDNTIENSTSYVDSGTIFNEPVLYKVVAQKNDLVSENSDIVLVFSLKDDLIYVAPDTIDFRKNEIVITNPFYASSSEITNDQYCDMLNYALSKNLLSGDFRNNTEIRNSEGISRLLVDLQDSDCEIQFNGKIFLPKKEKENHPMIEVTWYGAVFYCYILSYKISPHNNIRPLTNLQDWNTNLYDFSGYRLPTEAEWELICRQDFKEADYFWGKKKPSPDFVNYNRNPQNSTLPVAFFKKVNNYPFNDLSGNVAEWVIDWYHDSSSVSEVNPCHLEISKFKIIKGGSWLSNEDELKISFYEKEEPDQSLYNIGFRIIRIMMNDQNSEHINE